jgi:hypothetical protein
MSTDLRMVAPSLVTDTCPPRLVDCKILSMPLGPSEDLTRSAMASAPTIDAMRACSPLLSEPPASSKLTGEKASPIMVERRRGGA